MKKAIDKEAYYFRMFVRDAFKLFGISILIAAVLVFGLYITAKYNL